ARRRVHEAVAAWLLALSADRPVVLVVDDIHWADSSSRALVVELAALTPAAPIALLLSGRPEAKTLPTRLRSERAFDPDLVALGDAEIAEVVSTILGSSPPRDVAVFVAERSGGNPFFAQELVRSLQERAVLVLQDGQWRLQPGWDERTLPMTVENVL